MQVYENEDGEMVNEDGLLVFECDSCGNYMTEAGTSPTDDSICYDCYLYGIEEAEDIDE